MNIAFFGTPDISRTVLEKLNKSDDINIKVVVTKEDKKRGRKMILTPCETKQYALENNLNIITPNKLDAEFVEYLKSLDLDFIVVVAYGKILKQNVLDIPKKACINLHVSKLPQYRGPAPIQWAVLNGDLKTAATTMLMDIGMDTGDILEEQEVDIDLDMTCGELFDQVAQVGADLMVHTLYNFGSIIPRKQEGEPTYAKMIEKEIAQISWDDTSFNIHNKVRGLNPYLGAYSQVENSKIKIWKTSISIEQNVLDELNSKYSDKKTVGAIIVLNKRIFVKTKDGFIEILELQIPNSKKISSKEFLNGHKLDNKSFGNIDIEA